ncbi:MAG TPA: SgcJ/EcaC family oxidoreductase [Ktedonobacteraceae bacterium]|nr:SgcJ/EcaC family oxidoreductase [Ktedonobacteraceae bacterium]
MSSQILQNVVGRYFAALRARDAEAWAATFAENAVLHDPVGQPPQQGRDAIRGFAEQVFRLCTNFGLREEAIFLAGNEAAVKWNGYAVGKNGHEITFAGIEVIALNEAGTIQTVRAYWDPTPVLAELQAA